MTAENKDLMLQNKPDTRRVTLKTGLRALAATAAATLFGRNSNVASADERPGGAQEEEDPFLGSKEHAALKESIADAISDQELREHNIFIYPAPNTDLAVRRSFLQEDTILQTAYRKAESTDGPKPKVEIILVDSPYLNVGDSFALQVPEEFREQYQQDLINNQKPANSSELVRPVGLLEGLGLVTPGGDYRIYLAVGGYRQPIADYSLQKISDLTLANTPPLTIENIKKKDSSIIAKPTVLNAGGHVQVDNRRNAGMVLRRLLDQNPPQDQSRTDKDRSNNMTVTEVKVFTRYNDALERFEQTGDDSGFPYVFITETGLAYM